MAPTGFLKSQHPRNGDVALDARLVEQDDQDKRERKNNDHNDRCDENLGQMIVDDLYRMNCETCQSRLAAR